MRASICTFAVATAVALVSQPAFADELLSGGDYVKAHNDLRAKHCVPPLKRSEALEKAAAAWAKQLASERKSYHDPNTKHGENLAGQGRSSPAFGDDEAHKMAAAAWYSEIKDYKFNADNPSSESGPGPTGHFTAMIWKATTEVGCANVAYQHDDMHHFVSVCRYAPAGNDVSNNGALYKANVPQACK